ncbi:MAG: UDP-N-acetylmuramate dehydrogenase [Betaproteobacteria bacterium AqS2]|uniref:UDP-N-acetylenolpyruvoylglucosamine reductase n=1 Tax=Candidatus Amphirhobacter heronislandensis TaxID=1732024 RepID=A0A930UGH1_9GAMM|nr:UDP-N-acetylmuramate dehydrogenase [Betaproteobacteria bacterium AqS2]
MSAAAPARLRGRWDEDVPMARYSSWRAGGRARRLFQPADQDDLREFLAQADGEAMAQLHFIGLGSNLLVRDAGVAGTVVRMGAGLRGLRLLDDGTVYAEAGVAMPKLARFAKDKGLGGAGFMAGIPGTVGGALAMNAGCFGRATWETVERVALLAADGAELEIPAAEFSFGYRSLSHPRHERPLFLAAWLRLPPPAPGEWEEDARQATQPIGTPNAGSVFVNPAGDAAGRLIEEAGLAGHRIGAAQISPKHCNFIVNLGGASAADIEDLIEAARAAVRERFGVDLRLEVRIIGERA